ncbi:MAG: hypothetical protein KDE32_10020 [Novosphingobium sp.]|nr:hypothetical protein [Novosphingobium sp.]
MTKLRPPFSAEQAVTRIAGVIGWDRVAEICGQGESAVRKWTNPDTSPSAGERITFDQMRALDTEYAALGGEGAPLLQCQAILLEVEALQVSTGAREVASAAAKAAKESGEALAAAFIAAQPGATHADLLVTERELEEDIEASTQLLAIVRKRRSGNG